MWIFGNTYRPAGTGHRGGWPVSTDMLSLTEELVYKAKIIPANVFKQMPLVSVKLENVEEIGGYAFNQCSMLSHLDLGHKVKTIGTYAFAACESLQSLEFTSSLTVINSLAFEGVGLTSLNIPASVSTIGLHAFQGFPHLLEVTVNWNTPLSVSSADPFLWSNIANIQLNVPVGKESLYKADGYWKQFYIPEISYYSPKVIAGSGTSSISIRGADLNGTAEVRLTQGSVSVSATSVSPGTNGVITANFTLSQIPGGSYQLHVRQAGVIDKVIGEITVQNFVYPEVVSSITGIGQLRTGFTQTAHLVL
ncbi:MAG: leucine-rich repeat domain-containing protein [Tannerella sp.]|jgi:hypothetical protein|nr:leucine-rich repeat domain-containing protein [Tannerella sp.]